MPADFLELLNSTAQWREVPVHGVGGYNGPWVENVWVNNPSLLEELPGRGMFWYGMDQRRTTVALGSHPQHRHKRPAILTASWFTPNTGQPVKPTS